MCAICGEVVAAAVEAGWTPRRQANHVLREMQAHLELHSFPELLRFEIRQELDMVPDDQRPTIVRDIYRNLLGSVHDNEFTLNPSDGIGVYSLDEALGDLSVYQLWRAANRCGTPDCPQHTAS
jgi:hypothetical protein